jgi:hypothetical protein
MALMRNIIAFSQISQNLTDFEAVSWLYVRICFLMALFILGLLVLGWAILACIEKLGAVYSRLMRRFDHGGRGSASS